MPTITVTAQVPYEVTEELLEEIVYALTRQLNTDTVIAVSNPPATPRVPPPVVELPPDVVAPVAPDPGPAPMPLPEPPAEEPGLIYEDEPLDVEPVVVEVKDGV